MAVTPLKMLLFLGGASGAAVGTAFVTGALDPLFGSSASAYFSTPQPEAAKQPAAEPAAQPPAAQAPAEQSPANAPEPAKPEQQAAVAPQPDTPAKPAEAAEANTSMPIPPSFDILRVEPDGSIVIAGQAAPKAEVEILSGSKVLGKVTATGEGDFAVALDDPLKPGDYQLVLRSTTTSRIVANSKETAVVSIPETKDGQVLALVEQPGAPSRLITKPAAPVKAEQPAEQAPAKPAETAAAQPTPETPPPGIKGPRPAPAVNIAVDAVEIEGRKIFVAGASEAGRTVRVYANDILLGDAKTSPEGRFLIETERDLPVGDYVIRADVLGPDGAKVVARAAVPFSREPGESIAAVAPEQPAPAAPATTEPAAPRASPAPQPDVQTPPASDQPVAEQPSEPSPSAASQTDTGSAPAETPNQQQAEQPAEPAQPQQPQTEPGQQAAAVPEGAELAPKLKPVDGSVIIRRGDSLWRISRRVYGRGVRYSTIYLANQEQIKNPDMIWPGQIFKVPETTEQGEKADMDAVGDQKSTQ